MAPNARTAAIYYFITALFILLACFDTYFALPINVRIIFFIINFITKLRLRNFLHKLLLIIEILPVL